VRRLAVLSVDIQRALAQRYGGGQLVKEAFDQTLVKALKVKFQSNTTGHSACLYIDIAGFAGKVGGKSPTQIGAFLDDFYKLAIPRIYRHHGHIDRIAGDGIVAIFSPVISDALKNEDPEVQALLAAEDLIQAAYGTSYVSKAALSAGDLLFCKTGLADVYEDYTVIGSPLTVTYRLEESAKANQVAIAQADKAKEMIDIGVRNYKSLAPGPWSVKHTVMDLRGVGDDVPVCVQTYKPVRLYLKTP
jgi:class 3 adenylate cyclase